MDLADRVRNSPDLGGQLGEVMILFRARTRNVHSGSQNALE
jgi:hypothetical protein